MFLEEPEGQFKIGGDRKGGVVQAETPVNLASHEEGRMRQMPTPGERTGNKFAGFPVAEDPLRAFAPDITQIGVQCIGTCPGHQFIDLPDHLPIRKCIVGMEKPDHLPCCMPDSLVHGIVYALVGFGDHQRHPVRDRPYNADGVVGRTAVDDHLADCRMGLHTNRFDARSNGPAAVVGSGDDGEGQPAGWNKMFMRLCRPIP